MAFTLDDALAQAARQAPTSNSVLNTWKIDTQAYDGWVDTHARMHMQVARTYAWRQARVAANSQKL